MSKQYRSAHLTRRLAEAGLNQTPQPAAASTTRLSAVAEAFINEAATGKTQDCYFDHKPGGSGLFDREKSSAALGV
jgi:hypothetical protein